MDLNPIKPSRIEEALAQRLKEFRKTLIDPFQVAGLFGLMAMSPAQQAQRLEEERYERDCMRLQAMIGPPGMSVEAFRAIVSELASQSLHSIFYMPDHLACLLSNKWLIEGMKDALDAKTIWSLMDEYPIECKEQCLAKFLALIEKSK